MFVWAGQPALRLWKWFLCSLDIHHWLILDQQSGSLHCVRLITLICNVISMHIAAESTHSIELAMVEHFAELLELILRLSWLCMALFLVEHALESVQVSGVFDKAGNIDLSADEVAENTTGVE
jgi:hypothetical protein